jgi:hypothetical protein
MKTALCAIICLMLSTAAIDGAESGFDDIVRTISDELHARPMHVPFFGLAKFAIFVAHPAGVKHLELAVFPHGDFDRQSTRSIAEAIEAMHRDWSPFVRVRNARESVLVYMTQERNDCKLLVVAVETNEATVVEVRLNPEGLQAWLRDPEKSAVKQ